MAIVIAGIEVVLVTIVALFCDDIVDAIVDKIIAAELGDTEGATSIAALCGAKTVTEASALCVCCAG